MWYNDDDPDWIVIAAGVVLVLAIGSILMKLFGI
tara:strand:+ start:1725 stop:1826 length:102 start_codon:yes stop_codon:yes gene_type:complete